MLLRELRLCDAVVFLNSSASQLSMWCHTELAVAIELGKRVYSLDLTPGLAPHPLLRSLQGIRFETTIEAGIQRLTVNLSLDGLAQGTRFRWERDRAPYPGLVALDVADAGVFFGREEEVRRLVARVDAPLGQPSGNLVVVMGPSGRGNPCWSAPGWRPGSRPRSGWWWPGRSSRGPGRWPGWPAAWPPSSRSGRTDSECQDRLVSEGIGAVGEWLIDHTEFQARRVLITVDQAEQLATFTAPQEAAEFLAVLGKGLGAGSPVTVVMTVRSDRLDEIQRLPVVGPMIDAPFVIGPIRRSQLAAIIEGPAGSADLTFSPGLVGRLIDDAVRGGSGDAVDALPFLAFTLREMYDLVVQEGRSRFTDADYERVGCIEGAIIRRTQDAESRLPPGRDLVLERLLPRFVTLSEDRPPAGRSVPRDRLSPAEKAIAVMLEDQRLLTGTGDTVRLAHEQLISAWPRLARAVADRRDDLLLEARLERQAGDWKRGQGELLGRDAAAVASSGSTNGPSPEPSAAPSATTSTPPSGRCASDESGWPACSPPSWRSPWQHRLSPSWRGSRVPTRTVSRVWPSASRVWPGRSCASLSRRRWRQRPRTCSRPMFRLPCSSACRPTNAPRHRKPVTRYSKPHSNRLPVCWAEGSQSKAWPSAGRQNSRCQRCQRPYPPVGHQHQATDRHLDPGRL